jgi:hypothetical protein
MGRNIIRILAPLALTATIITRSRGQTQPVHENDTAAPQFSQGNVSATNIRHSIDPRLHALDIGPTNGLLVFYKSRRPLTLIDSAAADSVTNGITLKQLIQNLGPGWKSPDDGIGLINWTFKDGRELEVLQPRFNETAAKIYTAGQMHWFTNNSTEIIKTNDPVPQPRYVRF